MTNFFTLYQLVSRVAVRTDYSYFRNYFINFSVIVSGVLFFFESNYKVKPLPSAIEGDSSAQEFKRIDEENTSVAPVAE